MIFSWLKKRRWRRILAQPFPDEWERILRANVRHYGLVTDADREKMRRAAAILIAEKSWEGQEGMVVTDEVKVTIAGQASVLLLGVEDYYFDEILSVLVYPDSFRDANMRQRNGIVYDEAPEIQGQLPHGGPVRLSWNDALHESREPGETSNLVIHEFSHHIDALNGAFDGVPPMPLDLTARWSRVFDDEFERHIRRVDRGRGTLLDPYGAKNHAEFFAVVSECFFMEPRELRSEHPELYAIFHDFYKQNPAEWGGRRDEGGGRRDEG